MADRYAKDRVGKWCPIPGYEKYEAARSGLIRSARTKKLRKTSGHRDGYDKLNLFDSSGKRRTFHVHILIALTFLGPRPSGHLVDHKDLDHTNNAAWNLRYATLEESNQNRKRRGTSPSNTSERNVFHHGLGGYYVRVYVSKRLGRFETIEEAVAARDRFKAGQESGVMSESGNGLQDGGGGNSQDDTCVGRGRGNRVQDL